MKSCGVRAKARDLFFRPESMAPFRLFPAAIE